MTGASLSAFLSRAQEVVESLFPCTIVIASTTISAARSPWRKGAPLAEFGGGAYPVEMTSVRILRTELDSITVKANATTLTIDGTTAKVLVVRDMKNDPALLLECVTVDP